VNIIVAFAKPKDIQNFKSILSRGGYDGVASVSSGVQALSVMDDLGSGVIICGYRLNDMLYSELLEDLPPYFKMLLIAGPSHVPSETSGDNFMFLQAPLKADEFYSTISLMLEGVQSLRRKAKQRRLNRSDADRKTIEKAKVLLMERHHMSEPQAHKYLQRCAMDSGTNMVETAEMIISLNNI
jgi:response regulator NasT